MSLITMALAFVLAHPAVTSPIIGPRTMEQLEDPARRRRRDARPWDVLDRIDEIVPPGTTVSRDDAGWTPPVLKDPKLRRRVTRLVLSDRRIR